MGIIKTIKPIGKAGKTTLQLNDPGITYNETGVTYNEIGITYGGLYGSSYVIPQVATVKQIKP